MKEVKVYYPSRYLQQPQSLSAMCNYHFFNAYFYNKLQKLSYREDSFIKFRKRWKGVNIFEKAYILIPVHDKSLICMNFEVCLQSSGSCGCWCLISLHYYINDF